MITTLALEDGTLLAADSASGRTCVAEPDSAWALRAADPAERQRVAEEMLGNTGDQASPADVDHPYSFGRWSNRA
jgi:hypothetical protein